MELTVRALLIVSLFACACRSPEKPEDTSPFGDDTGAPPVDADGDGYVAGEDCEDDDAAVHPGADELCNGVDDDCDGEVDEDDAIDGTTWFLDEDGDGYGLDSATIQACAQPTGYAEVGRDCDDTDPAYHPGAPEDDCTDPADYDCDGVSPWSDEDGDGWATCEDCDDTTAAVNPGATELCNGVDDDCDGEVDEADAADAATWYADADGDGYGDADVTTAACDQALGFVTDARDCDDANSAIHPDATELCDGYDDDCDGLVDEADAADAATWYADADGDGYGDPAVSTAACTQPSSYLADASDCDDSAAAVNPAATELCNGVDDDCDAVVDEDAAADAATWYADADGDGYGDPAVSTAACTQPSGYLADASDCDDSAAAVNPAATELCNGVDDDCDAVVDEDAAADAGTWYLDADGDGFGDAAVSTAACTQPSGYLADASDCDDSAAAVNPAATELCNGVDDDCDAVVDEDAAADAGTWYLDADGDGFGDAGDTLTACTTPSGYVADATDCDDDDSAIHPGAVDECDGLDADCDGDLDEDSTAGDVLLSVDTNWGYSVAIDTDTGVASTIAAMDTGYTINTVAIAEDGTALGNDYSANRVVEVDYCTGAVSPLGAVGTGNSCGISFGPDGRLFGLDSTNDELVEIDPTTGAWSTIGALGYDVTSCGLAYDCTNDVLIGATANGDVIFSVSPDTGVVFDVVYTDVPFGSVGLEFDPVSGLLYAANGSDLYTIEPTTGAGTLVGTTGGTNIDDLVFAPACD